MPIPIDLDARYDSKCRLDEQQPQSQAREASTSELSIDLDRNQGPSPVGSGTHSIHASMYRLSSRQSDSPSTSSARQRSRLASFEAERDLDKQRHSRCGDRTIVSRGVRCDRSHSAILDTRSSSPSGSSALDNNQRRRHDCQRLL